MYYFWGKLAEIRRVVPSSSVLHRVNFSTTVCWNQINIPGLATSYNPKEMEPVILKDWLFHFKNLPDNSSTLFSGSGQGQKKTFRMILPPPNVTGKLHLGHTLTVAIQDTIARWQMMNGKNVEWIPGFDHAGIATQTVVNRKLSKDSDTTMSSSQIGTEIVKFSLKNISTITQQLTRLTGLLKWDSSYYTMDEEHGAIVDEAFINLLDSGYIRRENGIVNWCCALKTTVSDVEVDKIHITKKTTFRVPGYDKPVEFGMLYYILYQVENSEDKITVATSRPETMFGDVALAVHPADKRWNKYIGCNVINPINGRKIPVVGDCHVKEEFGSGVLKITPCHSKMDLVISMDHGLNGVTIFDERGYLNDSCGREEYKGMPRFLARKAVMDEIVSRGLLVQFHEYSTTVSLCSRTGDVIEPRILPHWYLKTKQLTEHFLQALTEKEIVISPDYFGVSLTHALANVQDWCLSRQIIWGHQVPVYSHPKHPNIWVGALSEKEAREKLKFVHNIDFDDIKLIQDKDVLDTWFSSALIPLAVNGWPTVKTPAELSMLETGGDIILYWVWRMSIVGQALTGKWPFRHILLHGLVTDHYGRKMSKSRGNVIDPMDVVNGASYEKLLSDTQMAFSSGELDENEYKLRLKSLKADFSKGFAACGSDGLRYALLLQDIHDQEIKLNTTNLDNCKTFCNKIWQAYRYFVLNSMDDMVNNTFISPNTMALDSVVDRWILSCLYKFAVNVEAALESNRFHHYAESVRRFFYQQFCNVYIELIKDDMKYGVCKDQHILVMRHVFTTALKLAHPLLPFVTEGIWFHMTSKQTGILVQQSRPRPTDLEHFHDEILSQEMKKVLLLSKEIRSLKTRAGVRNEDHMFYINRPLSDELRKCLECLTKVSVSVAVAPDYVRNLGLEIIVHMNGELCRVSTAKGEYYDNGVESARVKIEKYQKSLLKLQERLNSKKFQNKATPEAKKELQRKMDQLQKQIEEAMKDYIPQL